ncbi:MAG: cytochrome c [Verrucomicrobiota bacterium]|nr:cytochrome c [Verrucomicrobiota bacterium]
MNRLRQISVVFAAFWMACALFSIPPYVQREAEPLYKEFLDSSFPFVEATVDLRGIAPSGNTDNLIPRAIVLPLKNDVFVCFDTELLRVAGVWKGGFLTPRGLAMLSYEVPLRKMGGGQKDLPKPLGEVVQANGLYPGWQESGSVSFRDPRSRWLDEKELGRGPLDPQTGEWSGIEVHESGAVLKYTLYGGRVEESYAVSTDDSSLRLLRTITIQGIRESLTFVVSDLGEDRAPIELVGEGLSLIDERYVVARVDGSSGAPVRIVLATDLNSGAISIEKISEAVPQTDNKGSRWPETISAGIELGEPQGIFAVDEAIIPYPNPWKRRIRPVAIDFFPNGDAVLVTFDGDVYRLSGLGGDSDLIEWRRIAAGFNEPQSIRIRDNDIFVFSRLGITRLLDLDDDGETDYYEMFCNRFTQSADTRDYPMSLALRPDGSFAITKGGQQVNARSPHSGRAMTISADGKRVDYLGYGLRNAYISSHPTKDLITASDQQGHWVPSTPFLVIRDGRYFGYDPGAPESQTRIHPPALWMPHRVVQSGIEQLWPMREEMGPLKDSILYIEYKKPSLFQIFIPDEEDYTQTAGIPLPIEFETPILKGAINPIDGSPYLAGFQIWDSVASRLEGLCRLRVLDGANERPIAAEASENGVLLTFDQPLGPERSLDPANYQISSWEYKRTSEYGSPQFKADGTPGADEWFAHSVFLSKDRKSVFLAIEEVRETMQLEVQYNLFGKWAPVYLTVNDVISTSLQEADFEPINFAKLFASEPTPREKATRSSIVSVARGQQLYAQMGCVGCHSIDGTTEGRSGPTWLGAFKSRRTLKDGSRVRVDEAYLRTSILDPAAVVTVGYDDQEAGMPSYRGILSNEDVDSLVLFIRSLR